MSSLYQMHPFKDNLCRLAKVLVTSISELRLMVLSVVLLMLKLFTTATTGCKEHGRMGFCEFP